MDNFVIKYASTGILTLYNQLSRDERVEFIDPLCAILKLSLLHLKKCETKISIKNNVIHIQDPWVLQGAIRWFNSEGRDQLHQLRLPILYFRGLELGYIDEIMADLKEKSVDEKVPSETPSGHIAIDHTNPMLAYFSSMAKEGLIKLNTTYEISKKNGSLIRNCLGDYIRILTHRYTLKEYKDEIAKVDKSIMFVIYSHFLKKWEPADLQMIHNIYQLAISKPSENVRNQLADAINHLLMAKDLEIDVIRPG